MAEAWQPRKLGDDGIEFARFGRQRDQLGCDLDIVVGARSTKAAAPIQTSTLVRKPALLSRYWRSAPIRVPNTRGQTG
jgi:hypothetical protein